MNMMEGDGDGDHHGHGSLCLPPGFRFHPMDEEIITHYLWEKVLDNSFTATAIGEVDLNKCEPWDLPGKAKMGEKEWFFFCQRDRKYPTGMRTNRATEAGYWKATGKDKEIFKGKGNLIGMKKTLVFYTGRAPKGEKTNWVIHEFRLEGKSSYNRLPPNSMYEWVVCRVFHKDSEIKMIRSSCESNEMMMMMMARGNTFSMNSSLVDEFLVSPTLPPLVETSTDHHHHQDQDYDYTTTTTTTMDPNSSTSQFYTHHNQPFLTDTQNNNYNFDQMPDYSHQTTLQMSVASQETAMSTDQNPEISSLGLEIGCGHYYDDDGFENLWK